MTNCALSSPVAISQTMLPLSLPHAKTPSTEYTCFFKVPPLLSTARIRFGEKTMHHLSLSFAAVPISLVKFKILPNLII